MNHIDEHTIEMYVLGSGLVTERRGEIESHFKECHGCRTLAEQMEEFYQKAEEGLEEINPELAKSKALVRSRVGLPTMQEPYGFPAQYTPTTPLAKVFYFIRRHPVTTVVTGFTAIAALGWFLNDAIRNFSSDKVITDKNPSYPHINPNNATIEIYNKENQLLWFVPTRITNQISQTDLERLTQQIIISDLDGDKNNEVITTLRVGGGPLYKHPVTIFSYTGTTIREIKFNEQVQFRGAKYEDIFGANEIICEDFESNGKKEIITVINCGRSPSILNRLTKDGSVLGQYFHFGVAQIAVKNIHGKRRILYFGQNNVDEPDSLSFAVMCVLDPLKIIGKTEASDSRGFGLQVSNAEIFMIRFPFSDMNYVWKSLNEIERIIKTTTNGITTINVHTRGLYRGKHPIFEYIFNENMELIEVKYNSGTLQLRMESIANGKISGTIDKLYLDNLKKGVRYWDGKSWQKELTMVVHDGRNVANR
jgi:hypothetical protein